MISRVLVSVSVVVAIAAAATAQASRDELRERYGVLLERNMFLKDRRPAPPPREDSRGADAPPPVESLYVVIGLVEEGEAFRAHVEDRRSGELLLLKPGDPIAQGTIAAVDLDGVVYASGETRTRIAIGQDLRGEAAGDAPATAPDSSTPSESGGAATGDAPPADGAGTSIEERMRQRRLQGG